MPSLAQSATTRASLQLKQEIKRGSLAAQLPPCEAANPDPHLRGVAHLFLMRMHALLARRRRTDEASRPDSASPPSCGNWLALRTSPAHRRPTSGLALGAQACRDDSLAET